LHDAIWDEIQQWVRMYTADSANQQVLDYVYDAVSEGTEQGHWGVDGNTLSWMFKDFAGCCSRSANAWAHWVQLALASEWDSFAELAERHELQITSEPPVIEALLVDEPGFVAVRNNLWSTDEDCIYGDDETLQLSELDDAERARFEAGRARCMCGPCT